MSQVQLQQLQKQLWNIANDLRGKMGADEFRDYILGFIFYKYLYIPYKYVNITIKCQIILKIQCKKRKFTTLFYCKFSILIE